MAKPRMTKDLKGLGATSRTARTVTVGGQKLYKVKQKKGDKAKATYRSKGGGGG